jgi:hypothetical protein
MQSSIFSFWYQTEIIDAGIPMPALVSSMPMPSFAHMTYGRKTRDTKKAVKERVKEGARWA